MGLNFLAKKRISVIEWKNRYADEPRASAPFHVLVHVDVDNTI